VIFKSTTLDDSGNEIFAHYARSAVNIENSLSITSATSDLTCSFAGGCIFEVEADGLTSKMKNLKDDNHIYACGKECMFYEDGSDHEVM